MNNKGNMRLTLIAAGVMSAGALTACFNDESAKVVRPVEDSLFVVRLVDEKRQPISGTIQIEDQDSGPNDAARFSSVNDDVSKVSYTAGANGIVFLDLVSSSDLIKNDPLDVVFVGSASGYIASSKLGSYTASGQYAETIILTSKTAAATTPTAYKSVVGNATVSGGIATNDTDLVLTTDKRAAGAGQAAVKGTAKVRIPAGTQMSLADGTAPAPGPITLETVYFDNDTDPAVTPADGALALFPGGLTGMQVSGQNPGSMASAGFAAIELRDSAGKLITKFNGQKVEVEMVIPDGTPYPSGSTVGQDVDSNSVVSAGDTVPVWSYDEIKGRWTPQLDAQGAQQIATVQTRTVGGQPELFVTFTSDHLSYFNLDFYFNTCASGANGTVSVVDKNGVPNNRTLNLYLKLAVGNGGWANESASVTSSFEIYNLPSFAVSVGAVDPANPGVGVATFTPSVGAASAAATSGALAGYAAAGTCNLIGGVVKLNVENGGSVAPVPVSLEIKTRAACSNIAGQYEAVAASGAISSGSNFTSFSTSASGSYTASIFAAPTYTITVAGNGSEAAAGPNKGNTFTNPLVLTLGTKTCATGGTGGTGGSGGTL